MLFEKVPEPNEDEDEDELVVEPGVAIELFSPCCFFRRGIAIEADMLKRSTRIG